jgi:hypothetical protein
METGSDLGYRNSDRWRRPSGNACVKQASGKTQHRIDHEHRFDASELRQTRSHQDLRRGGHQSAAGAGKPANKTIAREGFGPFAIRRLARQHGMFDRHKFFS